MPEDQKYAYSSRLSELESRIIKLTAELNLLFAEKSAMTGKNLSTPGQVLGRPIAENPPITPEEKIQLFLNLFRCRESVYPTLWENPAKGSKGYSPACRNEWVRGVCDEPQVKCSDCTHQDFPKFDGFAVQQHLVGKKTIGTYAIKEDDTCTFLACDFDGKGWTDDVLAYVEAGKGMGVPIYIGTFGTNLKQLGLIGTKLDLCCLQL